MRYAPSEYAHRPYRPPEMAGPLEVRPTQQKVREPGPMAGTFLAIALLAGAAFLITGFFDPSTILKTETSSLAATQLSH
jgi:hypothetical protein